MLMFSRKSSSALYTSSFPQKYAELSNLLRQSFLVPADKPDKRGHGRYGRSSSVVKGSVLLPSLLEFSPRLLPHYIYWLHCFHFYGQQLLQLPDIGNNGLLIHRVRGPLPERGPPSRESYWTCRRKRVTQGKINSTGSEELVSLDRRHR